MAKDKKKKKEKNPDDTVDLFGILRYCGHMTFRFDQGNSQGKILQILSYKGVEQQKFLQEKLRIQPGSMSELIGKLEAKGYVEKQKDELDQRKMNIAITEEGINSQERRTYIENNNHLFDVLSKSERQELQRLLVKLTDKWSKKIDTKDRKDEKE